METNNTTVETTQESKSVSPEAIEVPLQEPKKIDIGDLLKDYNKPMEVDPEPSKPQATQTAPTNNSTGLPPLTHTSHNGNPVIEYYKSGAKKGQPRPPRKTGGIPTGQPIPTQVQVNPATPGAIQATSILTGAMFILLIDMLFPMLIELANNYFSKHKIQAEKLRLSKQQREELAPIADMVVKQINLTGNPMILLSIALMGSYGINFMALKAGAK